MDEVKRNYCIAEAETPKQLTDKVNHAISIGWVPQGSVVLSEHQQIHSMYFCGKLFTSDLNSSLHTRYAQALVSRRLLSELAKEASPASGDQLEEGRWREG